MDLWNSMLLNLSSTRLMSINPILSETTLEFMLGQDEIFVRAKIQREFEYFDELNIIHNERSEF